MNVSPDLAGQLTFEPLFIMSEFIILTPIHIQDNEQSPKEVNATLVLLVFGGRPDGGTGSLG